ncbi:hypothetical protein PR048_021537 [Dryococelus australis]|uniref:Uncharacterized protein n=1 Tax=Dryococelus australis TaxID=614101 RepID=A0ABQ9GYI6_9NEOP|nr:hypothetical protein PR048_021537 [Dryococelus australis]
MEQRRNERVGETGDPRENPPTSGIVRHDSPMRKSVGNPAGNRTRGKGVGNLTTTPPQPLVECKIFDLAVRISVYHIIYSLHHWRFQPTSHGAVGWCAAGLGRCRLWAQIPAFPQMRELTAVVAAIVIEGREPPPPPPPPSSSSTSSHCAHAKLRTQYGVAPELKGGGNGRSPREPADQLHCPAHDPHMRKSGVTRPWIEPGSPWWEASKLIAHPPCPPFTVKTARRFRLPHPGKSIESLIRLSAGCHFTNTAVKRNYYEFLMWLPCSRTGSDSWRGRSRSFACGNRAGWCLWSAGFLGDLPFPPPLHSGAAPHPPRFILISSQDPYYKIRRNLFTHI